MQNVRTKFDDGECGARHHVCRLIILDIAELIKHAQKSIAFIKLAIIRENLKDEECAQDIQVLDDVTPRYAAAAQSLMNCKLALQDTLDAMLRYEMPEDSDTRHQHLGQDHSAM